VEHAPQGGSRWSALAAAVVAVLAALANLMSAHRATQALVAKNDAIVAFSHASDSYNYYEAKSIKQEVYKASILVVNGHNPAAQKIVDHEESTKAAVLAKARTYEHDADEFDTQSERLQHSHETLEIGVMFLEVAIVILSISSIAGTLVLPIIAAASALAGIGFSISGLPV
jgi:hypothetical protein